MWLGGWVGGGEGGKKVVVSTQGSFRASRLVAGCPINYFTDFLRDKELVSFKLLSSFLLSPILDTGECSISIYIVYAAQAGRLHAL